MRDITRNLRSRLERLERRNPDPTGLPPDFWDALTESPSPDLSAEARRLVGTITGRPERTAADEIAEYIRRAGRPVDDAPPCPPTAR
jgi:hypothetical protein